MTQERLSMRRIKEILRLKWLCGLSNRAIMRSCRISHSTVSDYLKQASAAGLQWPLPEELDEVESVPASVSGRRGSQEKRDPANTRLGTGAERAERAQCDTAPVVGGISGSIPGRVWV